MGHRARNQAHYKLHPSRDRVGLADWWRRSPRPRSDRSPSRAPASAWMYCLWPSNWPLARSPNQSPEVFMSIESNTGGAGASDVSRFTMREQVHGARYGEVLLVTGRLNRIEATVYNTLG